MQGKRDANPKMNFHPGLSFSRGEYLRRYRLVMDGIRKADIDALLVRGPENITYLTGYETPGYYGYHCLILVPGESPVLVGRRLEVGTNVPEFSWLTEVAPVEDDEVPVEVTIRTLSRMGLARNRLGIESESWFLTVNEHQTLAGALPHATLVDCSSVIEEARMIKSAEEVDVIRQAVAIADRACLAGIRATRPGTTEDRIAAAVYKEWCESGAEYTGLPNFIVSGPRSGACHATWRGRRLEDDDHCCFEIAASKHRYCGAIFRVATVGSVNPRLRRLSDAQNQAIQEVIDAIRPGAVSEEVDQVGRDVIAKAGFGKWHVSRLGYSIGINYPPDWGEGQIISIRQGEKRRLQENMTFHLVAGVLIPGEFGSGASASVRVTATGCEVLTSLPLQLYEN